MKIVILYQYMSPDDVVSAEHLHGLGQGLFDKGHRVVAMPCNRSRHHSRLVFPKEERLSGVEYKRIWRPAFNVSSSVGKVLSATWMLLSWLRVLFWRGDQRPDVIILGTDPLMAQLLAIPYSIFLPRARLLFWGFDLYPEAVLAASKLREKSFVYRALKWLNRHSYQRFDTIIDIGPCMRSVLKGYSPNGIFRTVVPWALSEGGCTDDLARGVRAKLFGRADLAILYSGNMGEAHKYDHMLALARSLRNSNAIKFCFAARGSGFDGFLSQLETDDGNICTDGFASSEDFAARLASADVHLVSLKANFTGIVVPSKFFGSLALGKPVIFEGSRESSIAKWICKYSVGWVLDDGNIDSIGRELGDLLNNPEKLDGLSRRCKNVYRDHFSYESGVSAFNSIITNSEVDNRNSI